MTIQSCRALPTSTNTYPSYLPGKTTGGVTLLPRLQRCHSIVAIMAPKTVTFIAPGAWLSLQLHPGLLPPELQDLSLPDIAPQITGAASRG